MEEMTGLKSGEVIGRRSFDVFPFLEKVGLENQYSKSLAGPEMVTL